MDTDCPDKFGCCMYVAGADVPANQRKIFEGWGMPTSNGKFCSTAALKTNVVFTQTLRKNTFAYGFLLPNGTVMDPMIMYCANSNMLKAGAFVATVALVS